MGFEAWPVRYNALSLELLQGAGHRVDDNPFSNSLIIVIINEEETKKITTTEEVSICDPNYRKIR